MSLFKKGVAIHARYVSETVDLHREEYASGAPALVGLDPKTGEQVFVATANIPGYIPPDGCVVIKDWSENEGVLAALALAGVIATPPIAWVRAGYTEVAVCRLIEP